jgi:putative addiction module component (TIGR02574 family)
MSFIHPTIPGAAMSTTLDSLQAEVLRLPPADRSRLLERLIASLDMDVDAEAAWDVEADRREAELGSGVLEPVPLEAAIARLEARFPG